MQDIFESTDRIVEAYMGIGQHVSAAIVDGLRQTSREHERHRRDALADINELREDWRKMIMSYEKIRKTRDASIKVAEEARLVFEKANADKNVTKAYVERMKDDYASKARRTLICKEEYIQGARLIKELQTRFYEVDLPAALNKLQHIEEARIKQTRDCLVKFGSVIQGAIKMESSQYAHMLAHWERMNAASVVEAFVDIARSERPFEYPEELNIDIGASPAECNLAVDGGRASTIMGLAPRSAVRCLPMAADNALIMGSDTTAIASRLGQLKEALIEVGRRRDGVNVLYCLYRDCPELADDETKEATEAELKNLCEEYDCLSSEHDQLSTKLASLYPADRPRKLSSTAGLQSSAVSTFTSAQSVQPAASSYGGGDGSSFCLPSAAATSATMTFEGQAWQERGNLNGRQREEASSAPERDEKEGASVMGEAPRHAGKGVSPFMTRQQSPIEERKQQPPQQQSLQQSQQQSQQPAHQAMSHYQESKHSPQGADRQHASDAQLLPPPTAEPNEYSQMRHGDGESPRDQAGRASRQLQAARAARESREGAVPQMASTSSYSSHRDVESRRREGGPVEHEEQQRAVSADGSLYGRDRTGSIGPVFAERAGAPRKLMNLHMYGPPSKASTAYSATTSPSCHSGRSEEESNEMRQMARKIERHRELAIAAVAERERRENGSPRPTDGRSDGEAGSSRREGSLQARGGALESPGGGAIIKSPSSIGSPSGVRLQGSPTTVEQIKEASKEREAARLLKARQELRAKEGSLGGNAIEEETSRRHSVELHTAAARVVQDGARLREQREREDEMQQRRREEALRLQETIERDRQSRQRYQDARDAEEAAQAARLERVRAASMLAEHQRLEADQAARHRTQAAASQAAERALIEAERRRQQQGDAAMGFLAQVLFDFDGLNARDELSVCAGDLVTITADDGEWWHAVAADGRSGYVPFNFVFRVPTVTPTPSPL